MKKSVLFSLFLLLSVAISQAQVGIKAGVNIASISEENENVSREDLEERSIAGPVLGLTFDLPIGSVLLLQPELLYAQSGGRNTYNVFGTTTETTYRINYFEVPVLAKLQFGNNEGDGIGFHIAAGPWAGLALNGKTKTAVTIGGSTIVDEDEFSFDDEDDAKRLNYGIIGAAGLSFGQLTFDLRYNYGINNLLDNDADNENDNKPVLQTRGLALTLGYRF